MLSAGPHSGVFPFGTVVPRAARRGGGAGLFAVAQVCLFASFMFMIVKVIYDVFWHRPAPGKSRGIGSARPVAAAGARPRGRSAHGAAGVAAVLAAAALRTPNSMRWCRVDKGW
eukprot:gene2557-4300_t